MAPQKFRVLIKQLGNTHQCGANNLRANIMFKLANIANGGLGDRRSPHIAQSSVDIYTNVFPQNSFLIILLFDCEVQPFFLKTSSGDIFLPLHYPQRFSNWSNLPVSERSYGTESWPFPDQNFSLGDSYHQAGPFFLTVKDSATHQLIPVTGSLLGLS